MKGSDQLFESTPLLDWLPDETLFSLVSRIHSMSGHGEDWRTSLLLFGTSHTGIHHDLPNQVSAFADRTGNRLGTADTIARERTLLRYYSRFLSVGDEHDAVLALSGNTVANLKYRLGLLTSRFRAHHPLKACASCMAADVLEHGWAYWHLEHQFPGVWWCHTHNMPLRESLLKSTGVGRFLWHLPSTQSLRAWPHEIKANVESAEASLSSLARVTTDLIGGSITSEFKADYLYQTYRVELARRGWLTAGGSLHLTELATSFLEYSHRLRFLPELGTLPTTIEESKMQIGRLLRPMRGGTHPIRHILLIDWLFGEAGSFLNLYRSMVSACVSATDEKIPDISDRPEDDKSNALKEKLIQLIVVDGQSVRATAQQLGIDTATAMVWAAQCGIVVSRRPKILKAELRQLLITSLRDGIDKAVAAETYGISIVTVTQVLRSEVGLHDAWQSVRREQARIKARSDWSLLLTEYGKLGTKLLRSFNPAVYAWLYRNDRTWLQQNLPARDISPSHPVGSPRVAWDKRDIVLSTAVEEAALEISSNSGRSKIQLWQLYQQVPELKAKLSVLDRLPITKRAIERILGRRLGKSFSDDLLS
jgi:hypothetical protein